MMRPEVCYASAVAIIYVTVPTAPTANNYGIMLNCKHCVKAAKEKNEPSQQTKSVICVSKRFQPQFANVS